MNTSDFTQDGFKKIADDANQRGSALVIAVLILALISVFVALALTRSATEAAAIGNETADGRTFYAAQGSLEVMTRNFNKIFETKINPSDDDISKVKTALVPGLDSSQYTFKQELDKTSLSKTVVLPGGPFAGLYAIRDNWRLRATATNSSGVQAELTRNLLNNRIPIFQFGIFYDDDLELYRPPRFGFGGRVHTNGNFFLSPGDDGVYFDSRVTAVGQVITQSWRNGYTGDSGKNQSFIKNASAANKQLFPDKASVLNTTSGAADNIFASKPDMPPSKLNPNWASDSSVFDGNLQTTGPNTELKLPVKIGTDTDLIELIKRGKKVADSSGGDLFKNASGNLVPVTNSINDVDNDILRAERYANKTGIRVSLADSKAKLPGCASGTGTAAITGVCGVRLDGLADGTGDITTSIARGYQPKDMKLNSGGGIYTATRVNGERLYTGREVWIKVETVRTDPTNGAIITRDITQDFLSLGMTEQAIASLVNISSYSDQSAPDNRTDSSSRNLLQTTAQTPSTGVDSRSIIKMQRFVIPGPEIIGGSSNYLNYYSSSGGFNAVVRYSGVNDSKVSTGCASGCTGENIDPNSIDRERYAHMKRAAVNGGSSDKAVVPFPIELFDTREGTFYDLNSTSLYLNNKVTKNGAMSVVDLDIANLRRFLRGDFNGMFPTDTPFAQSNGNVGLKNTDIPSNGGWVFYVSDRRGDVDFDGEYDMEDIYGYNYNSSNGRYYGCDGILEIGEDVNGNGILDFNSGNGEAPVNYGDDIFSDAAAVSDLKYYRRGVRLINGTTLPGIYDAAIPANTKGFTVASENGVYIKGNYNATGVAGVPSTGNTPYSDYQPFNTPTHIPASIVADGVTILSNAWNDAESFAYPYDLTKRLATDTTVRFAMISGDTIASKEANPNQGGISPQMNGGVHNFKRFLERWTDPAASGAFKTNLNYSGSLINLFNSHNANGAFKCCNTVYNPPIRNWVFDNTFLDATRLPPGTPFFQYVQITGFQRTNE